MQSKGIIRLFAILFALGCLYELSFTYVSRSVEKDAKAFAAGDLDKEQAYLDSMQNQTVFNLGIEKFTYREVKAKELNLGLDLRGGMNVILEVSVADILRGLSGNPQDEVMQQAFAQAKEKKANATGQAFLNTFFEELEKANQASGNPRSLSDPAFFGTKDFTDALGFNASDEEIKDEILKKVEASISNVFTVLRARIDQFGVVQPNIQRLEGTGRILIELPGVKEPERVQKLLQSTAQLEFWKLYEANAFGEFLGNANERLRTLVERPEGRKAKTKDASEEMELPKSVDDNFPTSVSDTNETETEDAATEEEKDTTDIAEPLEDEEFNPLFELFYPNIDRQTGRMNRGPILGFSFPKDTAKVNKYFRMREVRSQLPADKRFSKFLWTSKPDESGLLYLMVAEGNRDNKPELSGDVVVDARADFDERSRPIVTMSMNSRGAQIWQRMTREASQTDPKRSVAVVMDNLVFSYPQVQGEIPGGNTRISGNFTTDETSDLANILKAGKLPAPAKIIQSDVVGPSLGKEAISASLNSFIIALMLVLVYMAFYYAKAGAVADFTLMVNMFFVFGVLAALGAVLTLPGMAGIVLTIGMAVDANVLIFERIREELRTGKGIQLAIKDGYKASYSSIIDANVTTLLTGIILYLFGTGPIRGFATTLIIGILTSLFCAIFISRLVFEWMLKRKTEVTFSTSATKDWFSKTAVKFLDKRKAAYIISGILITVSIISLVTRGLNMGVDFVGGRTYQVRFDQPVQVSEIQSALTAEYVDENGQAYTPIVKTLGGNDQVVITTAFKVNETGVEIEKDLIERLYRGVNQFFVDAPNEADFAAPGDADLGLVASRQVGPTIAEDIKQSAIWAVLFSLIVVFLYILIRFKSWQYSLGAVAALVHDVIIILGAFSLLYGILPFQLEVDQAFIAAILTVVGYSLNDTVVVFDRIREYFTHYHRKRSRKEIINNALNGTLSRTFNTSVTTFFVLLIIFLFGGDVIRGFMFAILLGIIVGTYSSLFIATPVMYEAGGDHKDDEV